MTRKQRIFVLYTGGTIGMSQSSQGLRPDVALVGKALQPFSDGLQSSRPSETSILAMPDFPTLMDFFIAEIFRHRLFGNLFHRIFLRHGFIKRKAAQIVGEKQQAV